MMTLRAKGAWWPPIAIAIRVLMVVATVTFAAASLIHFGVAIAVGPLAIADPFQGAAVPEGIIAIVLGIGTVAMIVRWPAARRLALPTALFAFLATIYGLSVTARSGRTGDVTYHITILVVLALIVGLLLLPTGKRSLPG